MMDNVHTFKAHSGFGNYSLPTHFNRLSEQGVGGFKGPYSPTCSAASTLSLWVLCGQRGAWAPCIQVYLVYRELCHLVQYTCPIFLPLIRGL